MLIGQGGHARLNMPGGSRPVIDYWHQKLRRKAWSVGATAVALLFFALLSPPTPVRQTAAVNAGRA